MQLAPLRRLPLHPWLAPPRRVPPWKVLGQHLRRSLQARPRQTLTLRRLWLLGFFQAKTAFERQFKETDAYEQRQRHTKKMAQKISKARGEIGNKIQEQTEEDRPVIDTIPEEEEYVPEADLSDFMRVPDDNVLRELREG